MNAGHEFEFGLSIEAEDNGLNHKQPDGSLVELKTRLSNVRYLPTLGELQQACPHTTNDPYGNNAWDELTADKRWGEFLNTDFINALAEYLKERVEIYRSQGSSKTVLEAGAKDGKLAHGLRQQMSSDEIDYIPIDRRPRYVNKASPFDVSVEQIDYLDALAKYNPSIVVCSWMPYGDDFTQAIRSTPSVKEYILIGQEDMCGKAWMTYGTRKKKSQQNQRKPYQVDGFAKVNHLNGITKYQTAYRDLNPYSQSTSTVSAYRRKIPTH